MLSERLRLFLKLSNTNHFSLVKYVYFTNEMLNQYWVSKDVDCLTRMIGVKVAELHNNRIFVHPCPVDEALNLDYSFAGVYKSYKPFACMSATENVDTAIRQLLDDRFSYYAEYYYAKNGLNSTRTVDLFVSCENDNVCGYGTGYVDANRAIFQYYDSPLSVYRKEAKRIKSLKQDISKVPDKLQKNILLALFSVQEQIGGIIDIEFVFDRGLNIIINEVRSVSLPHRRKWNMLANDAWSYSGVTSIILNSIGKVCKKVKVWNLDKFDEYKLDAENEILCVQYESDAQIYEMLTWLGDRIGVSLIISYPHFTVDNHFSYVLFEDKTFDFILRCVDYSFKDGTYICVESNGINYSIKEEA